MTQTIFLVIIGILVLFLMVSIYYNIKHALIIIKLQDGIEDALDILDGGDDGDYPHMGKM